MFKIINELGKPLLSKDGTILVFKNADDAINFAHKGEPYQSAYTVVAFGRSGLVGAR